MLLRSCRHRSRDFKQLHGGQSGSKSWLRPPPGRSVAEFLNGLEAMWKRCLAAIGLAAAGVHGQFSVSDNVYTHTWLTKAALPSKRSDLTATTVGESIYLIGGCANDQEWAENSGMYLCTGISKATEKYTPATDSYETLAEAPRSRYRHAAAAVGGRIYLFGGCAIDDSIITDVDVLDTTTGRWSTAGSWPNATSDLSAFAHDGKIYVLGGYNRPDYLAMTTVMVFDPSQSGSAAWSEAPSLLQGRGDAAAATSGEVAFALGGFHHGNWSYPMDHLEVLFLNNVEGGWKERTTMDVARGDKAAAVLNGMLHIVGGESKNQAEQSVALMDVEVYDTATDSWYDGGSIPSNRFRFVAAALGDSIYIFGGQGSLMGSYGMVGSKYPVLDTVEQYRETVAPASVNVASPIRATILGLFSTLLACLGQ